MGKKSFYDKPEPNKTLAGEIENTPKNIDSPEPQKNNTPAAIEPTLTEQQQNKSMNKKGQKYLRLDITNYQDYISLMAEHMTNTSGKYVSMTQFILRLIEADKQQNIELYEKLEQIEKMKRDII